MLRGVVLELARRGTTVTVVARRQQRLNALANAVKGVAAAPVHGVTLDWRDEGTLAAATSDAISSRGLVDLAVVWTHEDAKDGPYEVARELAASGRPVRFVHVLGSATADPAHLGDARVQRFAALPHLAYEEVILGFVIDDQRSRWLTSGEIVEGILGAIDHPAPRTIVGMVSPWTSRP
ncbi:MAG: short-chain dehydrogenase [Dehalococcoidia bacterium]|nr:short-chain dehydrogenase [Dehalococcoidia bacterium]